jgi:hypothetical protein
MAPVVISLKEQHRLARATYLTLCRLEPDADQWMKLERKNGKRMPRPFSAYDYESFLRMFGLLTCSQGPQAVIRLRDIPRDRRPATTMASSERVLQARRKVDRRYLPDHLLGIAGTPSLSYTNSPLGRFPNDTPA